MAFALGNRREVHVHIRMTESCRACAAVHVARLAQPAGSISQVGQILHRQAVVGLQLQRPRELLFC